MVGIPGSGKTTLRKAMFPEAYVISPDDNIGYTKEDPWTFDKARGAWKKADNDLKIAFEERDIIVFDATFVSPKRRKKYIRLAKNNDFVPVAVFCDTSLKVSLQRNASRNEWRKIPHAVIENMFSKLVVPSKEEGFEEVIFYKEN